MTLGKGGNHSGFSSSGGSIGGGGGGGNYKNSHIKHPLVSELHYDGTTGLTFENWYKDPHTNKWHDYDDTEVLHEVKHSQIPEQNRDRDRTDRNKGDRTFPAVECGLGHLATVASRVAVSQIKRDGLAAGAGLPASVSLHNRQPSVTATPHGSPGCVFRSPPSRPANRP